MRMWSSAVLAMGLFLGFANVSLAQSTYSGDFIFNQNDFRQFELVGSGPITGGTSGSQLTLTSQNGVYNDVTYGNTQEHMDWSISIDKASVAAMFSTPTTTQYSGYFTDSQQNTTQTYIGAGTITGATQGNTVTIATSNGKLGVGGVNPANISVGSTPNVANFNWSMSFSKNDLQNFMNN